MRITFILGAALALSPTLFAGAATTRAHDAYFDFHRGKDIDFQRPAPHAPPADPPPVAEAFPDERNPNVPSICINPGCAPVRRGLRQWILGAEAPPGATHARLDARGPLYWVGDRWVR